MKHWTREALNNACGKHAPANGMQHKAEEAANSGAIGGFFQRRDAPSSGMRATQGIVRSFPGAIALAGLLLAACATNTGEMLNRSSPTMMEIWQGGGTASRTDRTLLDARQQLRRPPEMKMDTQSAYTRTAANEIQSQFVRLPNPDMALYVYPHLSGTSPVPGYTTVFPFYREQPYALPGERTEAY